MNKKNKANLFFKPYLKEVEEQALYCSEIDFIIELLNDLIPNQDDFLLEYFTKFPERLDSKVFDILIDTELRNILHDIAVRHAAECVVENVSLSIP